MPPTNSAAYLLASKAPQLQVKTAPYTSPKAHQIVIKNGAVAVNPIDNIKQQLGEMLFSWMKYPLILGEDVSGEVVEVGPDVTRFKVGDRVVGQAVGMEEHINTSTMCGFQLYTVLADHMVSPIPNSMSYESACVLPLCLTTAATGLFQKDQLGLNLPTSPRAKRTGKTLLIWGGASSVGCNAIQLAVAAGYEVFTTCSPHNFPLVKSLGATKAFDYKSPTVEQDLVRAFSGKTAAGAMSIGNGAAEHCFSILSQLSSPPSHLAQHNKFVTMASFPNPDPLPTTLVLPRVAFHYITWLIATWIKGKRWGIGYKFIWSGTLMKNELAPAIWGDFLGRALEDGVFVASPEPVVVGTGLEFMNAAMALLKKGVSGKKVVVSL